MSDRGRVARTILVAAILTGLLQGCRQNIPVASNRPKLVILGFDGLDPDLVRDFVARGQMPTFARMMRDGGLHALQTTVSPESPAAWASFATGVNPGKHNIYDFLVRDLATYRPGMSMVRTQRPSFLFDWIPTSRPKVTSLRGGTSFWVTAGRAGVRSTILTVPVTFPPEDVPNGELLSGMPVPDIRGAMGTYSYFATDLNRSDEGHTEFGGILKRLTFSGDVATTTLVGPLDPIDQSDDVTLPMTINWARGSDRAAITIGDQTVTLATGGWSRWMNLDFRINVFVRLHGMVQLYLIAAGPELQLYVSPVNFRPDAPPVPISSPASLAADVARRMGPFRTLGWAEATWALNDGRIDERTFMDDAYRAFDDRAQVILDRLTKRNWDLLVGVIETPDRVQHMMYRLIDPEHPMYDKDLAAKYGDSILRLYRRADQFVDQVSELLEPGTTLLVVSDHGFHTWRKSVNLNTWLVQQGYMTLQGQTPRDKTLDNLFSGEFWENVDWSKTRAYAMGLGQIYVNLRGREGRGIVSPGQEASALADELASKLKADLIDPDAKTHIVRTVYKRGDVYQGEFLDQSADLQVGFEDGYRVSWQTTLGGAPQGVVVPNMKKWSGDHGGFDYQTTAGLLLSTAPINTDTPRLIDIAPTVLQFFGVQLPADLDGRPLFRK